MYTTFLLFFFQIFKVYSRSVSSSSVAGLLLSAHFFVTHIQTEKISSWNGPTVHVCCFMLARASTKAFVSRVRNTAEKIFVRRKIHQQGHSLAEVSLYLMPCIISVCIMSVPLIIHLPFILTLTARIHLPYISAPCRQL